MTTVVVTNEIEIYKETSKEDLYKIRFINYDNSLINSITKTNILSFPTKMKDYLLLKAYNIQTFEEFMNNKKNITVASCLNILYFLSKQIEYLIYSESKCFYKIDTRNIINIDNNIFIYLSSNHLSEIENNEIQIYSPINKRTGLFSPELMRINEIPTKINCKTIFFSLGLLLISFLYEIDDPNKYNSKELLNMCHTIKETKLYYFLERCLCDDINDRYLLYL